MPHGAEYGARRVALSVVCLVALALFATNLVPRVPAASASPFVWEPPVLSDPDLVKLPAGPSYTRLARNRDYVIHLPDSVKDGYTMIEGGRNVVIIGGHVVVPVGGETDSERRGIYIKNANGVVHIEGLVIEGTDPRGFDGIAISAPNAIVQIVNVRVTGVSGRFDGFHGDVVQPFGGVRELRIDHLTATSNYQGLYLAETSGRIRGADIRNVDLAYAPNAHDATTYLLWLPARTGACETYPIYLEAVYIDPRPGQDVAGYAVWPNSLRPAACTALKHGASIGWPDLPDVDGVVTAGSPPGGDFVPEGTVGLGYTPAWLEAGDTDDEPVADPTRGGQQRPRGRHRPRGPNGHMMLVYGHSL